MAYVIIEDKCDEFDNVIHRTAYREVVSTIKDADREIVARLTSELGEKEYDRVETCKHSVSAYTLDDDFHCEVCLYPLEIGDKEWAVVKGVAHDFGGVDVTFVNGFDSYVEACDKVRSLYKDELANPSFYAGWDEDYYYCNGSHANLTVETRDSVVDIRVINTQQTFVGRGFDHLS